MIKGFRDASASLFADQDFVQSSIRGLQNIARVLNAPHETEAAIARAENNGDGAASSDGASSDGGLWCGLSCPMWFRFDPL